jgi:large subunit ribosomal protein L25
LLSSGAAAVAEPEVAVKGKEAGEGAEPAKAGAAAPAAGDAKAGDKKEAPKADKKEAEKKK